jgi:hypothetical protein
MNANMYRLVPLKTPFRSFVACYIFPSNYQTGLVVMAYGIRCLDVFSSHHFFSPRDVVSLTKKINKKEFTKENCRSPQYIISIFQEGVTFL